MGRRPEPPTSRFGAFLRERRQILVVSKAALAAQLGYSIGFWEAIENGRRGCNLDDIPRIADVLQTEPGFLAQLYLFERSPRFYAALFGSESPAPNTCAASPPAIQDAHARLDRLPRRERGIAEALIYVLDDLSSHLRQR